MSSESNSFSAEPAGSLLMRLQMDSQLQNVSTLAARTATRADLQIPGPANATEHEAPEADYNS